MMSDINNLSVLDMIADVEKDMPDGSSLFDDPPKDVIKEEAPKIDNKPKEIVTKEWTPSAEAMKEAGLDDRPSGVVYKKEDIVFNESNEGLKSHMDDDAVKESQETMDELDRVSINIERAKKKLGIVKLNIPQIHNAEIITLANDKDAFDRLVNRLDELTKMYPESVIERVEDVTSKPESNENQEDNVTELKDIYLDDARQRNVSATINDEEIQIIIDKRNSNQIVFDQEDIDKIKKARSVVLNVQEEKDVSFTIVDSDESTELDKILSTYDRQIGDFPLTLPASHYRCIVTGLSYPEIMDLSYSHDITDYDNEKKKWTIAFNHITNPSIGPFVGWIDPDGTEHTPFDDFMRKTSNHDLQLILWGVLCATTFDEESTYINCNIPDCKASYEWVYRPKDLIDMDSVPQETLNEMELVGKAQGKEEIENVYNSSCLTQKRMVTLSDSKFVVALCHSNAARYLNDVFPKILALRDNKDSDMTDAFAASVLETVDHILVPKKGTDGYTKVTKVDNIVKLLKTLSAVDCKTMATLLDDIATPYHFRFSMKNIKCPKCGTVSNIEIEDMKSMLFIITRSLENVSVELRRS